MKINKLLNTLSNPRLDILILYKFKKNITLINNLINYFESKKLMCGVVSSFKSDNSLYINDIYNLNNSILFDLIKKSYIVIYIDFDCSSSNNFFLDINKITLNNNKLLFNEFSSQYISKKIINKKYDLYCKDDLEFIYNNVIVKLFKKNYKIVAAISHMEEKTINLCLDSIKKQTIPIENIKVFQGLTPMCNSFNACLDFACDENADILLHTASDVVFEPWALKELLRIYDPTIHSNVLSLGEDILLKQPNMVYSQRTVCGIWIFNMNLFKDKQWRFRNEMKQDMKLFDRVKKETGLVFGDNLNFYLNTYIDQSCFSLFDIKYEQQNQGIHHPIWTLRETFDKYYYCCGKWNDSYKNSLLEINNEYLKYNPNNNCLIVIDYILKNVDKHNLKSKDSNELEKIYNNMIKNIPINNDINNNYFVYHEKYVNICNKLYDVNINIQTLDSIYNGHHNLFIVDLKKTYPTYSYYKITNHISKGRWNLLNENDYEYIIQILIKYKKFFIILKWEDNIDKIYQNLKLLIDNNYFMKKKNSINYLYVLLYDIYIILNHLYEYDSTKKRIKYLNYIINNSIKIKDIEQTEILEYNKIYDNIFDMNTINLNFDNNDIINTSYILENSFTSKINNNFLVLNEKNISHNHYIKLNYNVQKITIKKTNLSDRNLLFQFRKYFIYFNSDEKQLFVKDNDIINNNMLCLLNLIIKDDNLIFIVNTQYLDQTINRESMYLFFTDKDYNINYLGDHNKIYNIELY